MRWFWAMVAPALGAAWWSLRGRRERARYYAQRLSGNGGRLPPASVIVPVKGPEEGLTENLAALAGLDYPDYELIVTAREAADIPAGALPERARVALAGESEPDTAEKIANLLVRMLLPAVPDASSPRAPRSDSGGTLRQTHARRAFPVTSSMCSFSTRARRARRPE